MKEKSIDQHSGFKHEVCQLHDKAKIHAEKYNFLIFIKVAVKFV